MKSLHDELPVIEHERNLRDIATSRFDQLTDLLADLDLERLWETATATEQRTLVEDLVDTVPIYPDKLPVQIEGSSAVRVTLGEVGLAPGCKPVVSEGRSRRLATTHRRLEPRWNFEPPGVLQCRHGLSVGGAVDRAGAAPTPISSMGVSRGALTE